MRKWLWVLVGGFFVFHPGEVQAQRKSQPAVEHDTLTEWELVNGAAIELRQRGKNDPKLRQKMADLAIRSARGAERSLAEGNAQLFDSYRAQLRDLFRDTRGSLGEMSKGGSGAAEFALGVFAVHGVLEPADVTGACRHFASALEKGFGGARFRLSQCLEKSDPARATRLLREVADAGHPMASELVGRACLEAKPTDAACAYERLTVAAAAGRPSAQSLLALMYSQGVGGRKDPERAARLTLLAAQSGNAAAQNNAGEIYETGRGVAADPKQALEWYRKAAEAGLPAAQFNYGRALAQGMAGQKDNGAATLWLEKAEAAGITQARAVLDSIAGKR